MLHGNLAVLYSTNAGASLQCLQLLSAATPTISCSLSHTVLAAGASLMNTQLLFAPSSAYSHGEQSKLISVGALIRAYASRTQCGNDTFW